MHAKSGLRVVLKWKIYRPDSVIAAVMLQGKQMTEDEQILHAKCATYPDTGAIEPHLMIQNGYFTLVRPGSTDEKPPSYQYAQLIEVYEKQLYFRYGSEKYRAIYLGKPLITHVPTAVDPVVNLTFCGFVAGFKIDAGASPSPLQLFNTSNVNFIESP